MNAKNQLLHPFFLLCLFLLLWNDFFLKAAFSNAFTGKLSDFAGLVVFPVFIAGLFPGLKRWTALATGILFVLWKTPLVSPVIDWLNGIAPFHIQRVIDYSDYWALLILPVAHRMLNRDQAFKWYNGTLVRVTPIGISGIACFAICATTVLPRFGAPPGTIYIGKTYKIKKSEEEVIAMIRSLGYNVDFHSNGTDHPLTRGYYQTDNIVIYNDASRPIDTILNVKYNLYEQSKKVTQVEIINVTLREKAPIQKWQTLKFLSRQYRKALKQELIRKLN